MKLYFLILISLFFHIVSNVIFQNCSFAQNANSNANPNLSYFFRRPPQLLPPPPPPLMLSPQFQRQYHPFFPQPPVPQSLTLSQPLPPSPPPPPPSQFQSKNGNEFDPMSYPQPMPDTPNISDSSGTTSTDQNNDSSNIDDNHSIYSSSNDVAIDLNLSKTSAIYIGALESLLAGLFLSMSLPNNDIKNQAEYARYFYKAANDLPLTEADRASKIDSIVNNPKNYHDPKSLGNPKKLNPELQFRLFQLEKSPIVGVNEKSALIHEAKLFNDRMSLMKNIDLVQGRFSPLKIASFGIGALFLTSVGARTYIWFEHSEDPTYMPKLLPIQ